MTTLFLLGAGASYGSGECDPEPPPLGTQLFDKLLTRGGIFASIDAGIAGVFREDFERGMALFAEARPGERAAFLFVGILIAGGFLFLLGAVELGFWV